MKPTTRDWQNIKKFIPDNMKTLVELCIEFEDVHAHIMAISKVSGKDVSDVYVLVNRIMAQIFGLLKEKKAEEDTIKNIRADISLTLSNFFTEKGKQRDMSKSFEVAKDSGNIELFVCSFLAPLHTYVLNLYDTLESAKESADKKSAFTFLKNFCDDFDVPFELRKEIEYNLELPEINIEFEVYEQVNFKGIERYFDKELKLLINECIFFGKLYQHILRIRPYISIDKKNDAIHQSKRIIAVIFNMLENGGYSQETINKLRKKIKEKNFYIIYNDIYKVLKSAKERADEDFSFEFMKVFCEKSGTTLDIVPVKEKKEVKLPSEKKEEE